MKYQVSCDMTFADQSERDALYSYLEGKRSLAFQLPGDALQIDNPIIGGYRIACTYRLDDMLDQDEIFAHLQDCKTLVSDDAPGYIEKHLCRHEEGEPCTDHVVDRWE